jgi:hypothetical protein
MKFYCTSCDKEFETDTPAKKEYTDYILGACWKYVSSCPVCGQESDEKRTPKPQKLTEPVAPAGYCNGSACESCAYN